MSKTALALATLLAVSPAFAAPWLDTGDFALRADVERLVDAGLLRTPVTTWPLPVADILQQLDDGRVNNWSPAYAASAARLRRAARFALQSKIVAGVAGADTTVVTRHFDDASRSNAGINLNAEGLGNDLAGRISLQIEDDPADNDEHRYHFDGSYLATQRGNWITGFSVVQRWWGPARDNGLILSDNARPVPGAFIQRQASMPFETPWLSWLGPWNLMSFMGRLEEDRDHAHALLWGLRASARPLSWLEMGLSRTAQWGGAGRPQSLSTFWDVLKGNDNTGDNGIDKQNEPSNQMAGVDVRATIWRSDWLLSSAYLEYVGEDEANALPSHNASTVGASFSFPQWPQWQAFVESSDTHVRCFRGKYSCYYNHQTYTDGYRYEGRPLGLAFDNDSRTQAMGLIFQAESAWQIEAIARKVNANLDASIEQPQTHSIAPAGGEWTEAELRARAYWRSWRFSAGALVMQDHPESVVQEDRYSLSIDFLF